MSNQPGRLYAFAKTHNFNSIDEITAENVKFRPMNSHMGTYTHHDAEVIANYLKPLCQNEFTIDDTQSFPSMLKQQTPFSLDEEYVWYNVESHLTNIPSES